MYSLGGKFENCTVCPAGSACPDPAGSPVACTGGKRAKIIIIYALHVHFALMRNVYYLIFLSNINNKLPMRQLRKVKIIH